MFLHEMSSPWSRHANGHERFLYFNKSLQRNYFSFKWDVLVKTWLVLHCSNYWGTFKTKPEKWVTMTLTCRTFQSAVQIPWWAVQNTVRVVTKSLKDHFRQLNLSILGKKLRPACTALTISVFISGHKITGYYWNLFELRNRVKIY